MQHKREPKENHGSATNTLLKMDEIKMLLNVTKVTSFLMGFTEVTFGIISTLVFCHA